MSLQTGKKFHSSKWYELTIDYEFIENVHELALKLRKKLPVNNYPMFEWSPDNEILHLDIDMSPIDDNEIEKRHGKYVESINDEDKQQILADFQHGCVYITNSGSDRNEEDDYSDNNEEV